MSKFVLMIGILLSLPTWAVVQASAEGVEFTYDGEKLERSFTQSRSRDCLWCQVLNCQELLVLDESCVVLRGEEEIGVVTYTKNNEARFQKLNAFVTKMEAFRVGALLFVIGESRIFFKIFALPSCEELEEGCFDLDYTGHVIREGENGPEAVRLGGMSYSLRYPYRRYEESQQLEELAYFVERHPFIKTVPWKLNPRVNDRPKFKTFLKHFEEMAALAKAEVLAYLSIEEGLAFLSLIPGSSYFKSCHWQSYKGEVYYKLCLYLWRGEPDAATKVFQGLLGVGDCNAFAVRGVGLEERLHHQEIKEVIEKGQLSLILSPEIDWLGASVYQADAQEMINSLYEDPLNETLYSFVLNAYFGRFKSVNELFKVLVAGQNPYALALMHLAFRDGRWGVAKSLILAEAFLRGADALTIRGSAKL